MTQTWMTSALKAAPRGQGLRASCWPSWSRSMAPQLNRAHQVDFRLLRGELEYEIWSAEQLQEWRWNPLLYTELAGKQCLLADGARLRAGCPSDCTRSAHACPSCRGC